jgi:hypothetical protein
MDTRPSRVAGVASKAQKQVRLEMLPAGADWWLARSARAAMMALHLSGVMFRRRWKPPRLKPWEGPFADLPNSCHKRRTWPHDDWPHGGDGGCGRERRRSWRRSVTMPRAVISPHRAPSKQQRQRDVCAVIPPSRDPTRRTWPHSDGPHDGDGGCVSVRVALSVRLRRVTKWRERRTV